MIVKYRVVERLRKKYPVKALCRILDVSRSGYYAWRHRLGQEDRDVWLKEQIRVCQTKTNATYGYRRVCLWIKKATGITVNRKRVLRVMRQIGALSRIRRHRAYTHYKSALHRYENILHRKFEQRHRNLFWATDITYIPTAQGMCYLCAIIDQCGKMVLGYRIGTDMTASLVTDTVRDVLQKEKVADGLVLHSDQGAQYTAQTYYDLSQAYHFTPSMSKRGCPYDNSSMENFFGTLKAECLNRRKFTSMSELQEVVAQYVQFYNYERIQLKSGLTPYEIRSKPA